VINQVIGFRQSSEAQIGDIYVGTTFSDVFPYTPSIPVIGIQPQTTNSYYNGANLYVGDYWTFYTAASGLGTLSYQWYQNGLPLTDNGTTILGSTSNILTISNLSATATYYVKVANSAGSANSDVVTLNVNTTPTAPFFTTQPPAATNITAGTSLTLSARANGTGPITYTWYFQATNTSGWVELGTGSADYYRISSPDYSDDGLYHVVASGPGGPSATSSNVFVLVNAPALVSIGSLHRYMITNPPQGEYDLANNTAFTFQGVVTCFGQGPSPSYTEYRIQDATGAVEIYEGAPTTQAPPVGTWVQAQGTVEQYYGSLEMYKPTITVTNVGTNVPGVNPAWSSNIPLPAPAPLNLSAIQNATSLYGLKIDGSLVTVTNAYIYSSATGAPLNGITFPGKPGNSYSAYAFSGPYDAVTNTNCVEAFLTTYINISNRLNTNFWGVEIPPYCYELTGVYVASSDYGPQIEPSRLEDFVTNAPASFGVNIGVTNRQTTLTWPVSTNNNTYSIYSAPTVNGPWTQKFGLSYYPSTGAYTVTNTNSAQFFMMTSP
jgi:hypothetical protein